MIATNLLLRLLFTHFVMDFILQSDKMVAGRKSDDVSTRTLFNLKHSALHAIAAYVVVADWTNWVIPLMIFVSHFAIDFWYKKRKEGLQPFLIDQTLHIVVLVALWIGVSGQCVEAKEVGYKLLHANKIWLMLIGYILMLKPASMLMKEFISKWKPQLNNKKEIAVEEKEVPKSTAALICETVLKLAGKYELPKALPQPMEEENTVANLEDAGKWIGYIERVLILTFIFINCPEAIGFLLAAKSIFRYGDLKEAKDIKMTEYVLIGTLSSFSVAIVVRLFCNCISPLPCNLAKGIF